MQIDKFLRWSWARKESLMDNTIKRNESEQGSEEKNSGSRELDKDQDTRQPAILTSSYDDADRGLEKKGSKNAGLSEEFFLSDLSGD